MDSQMMLIAPFAISFAVHIVFMANTRHPRIVLYAAAFWAIPSIIVFGAPAFLFFIGLFGGAKFGMHIVHYDQLMHNTHTAAKTPPGSFLDLASTPPEPEFTDLCAPDNDRTTPVKDVCSHDHIITPLHKDADTDDDTVDDTSTGISDFQPATPLLSGPEHTCSEQNGKHTYDAATDSDDDVMIITPPEPRRNNLPQKYTVSFCIPPTHKSAVDEVD